MEKLLSANKADNSSDLLVVIIKKRLIIKPILFTKIKTRK
jgi:hypothetical protein